VVQLSGWTVQENEAMGYEIRNVSGPFGGETENVRIGFLLQFVALPNK